MGGCVVGLNGLGPKAVRRVAQTTGLGNIVRATVFSHGEYWKVMLTLDPHQHAVFDRLSGALDLHAPGPSNACTSLCWELFPDPSSQVGTQLGLPDDR